MASSATSATSAAGTIILPLRPIVGATTHGPLPASIKAHAALARLAKTNFTSMLPTNKKRKLLRKKKADQEDDEDEDPSYHEDSESSCSDDEESSGSGSGSENDMDDAKDEEETQPIITRSQKLKRQRSSDVVVKSEKTDRTASTNESKDPKPGNATAAMEKKKNHQFLISNSIKKRTSLRDALFNHVLK